MARPKKQTVDYFPHSCTHKKTMFILEQKYGNDGYAFWFKLLEMLGSTEGHCLSLKNGIDWEFLIAKTHLDKDKCIEIMNLLVTLKAIDKELWLRENKVWSDNFVDNIKDVYRNRVEDIPIKPSFLRKKYMKSRVSTVRNPQTKLKETKLKETKLKYKENNIPYKKIINTFNLTCKSLPKMEIITGKRKIVMKSRFNKYGLDKIKDVFNKTEESNFLTNRNGENKNNWIANFDWILDENNMAKILEGNYDNRKGKKIDWDKFMGEDNAK